MRIDKAPGFSSCLLALEPRWMFDGAAVVDAAHAAADASAKALIPVVPAAVQVRAADPLLDGGKREVAFVDTSVANYQALADSVRAGVEVELIGGGNDGLAQIAQWAGTHAGYDAIHVLSHGTEGQLTIGADVLSQSGLSAPVVLAELAEIGHSLKAGGDILIYGCDVAKGADGQAFVADLAAATGADVAASTDTTGRDGNWTLERATGAIEADRALTADGETGYGDDLGVAIRASIDGATQMAGGFSTKALEVSNDHRYVLFSSDCTTFGGPGGTANLFVGDTTNHTVTRVSYAPDGTAFTLVGSDTNAAAMAVDGSGHVLVVFNATASGQTNGGVFLRDLTAGTTTLLSGDLQTVAGVGISANGLTVMYTVFDTMSPGPASIKEATTHIYDRQSSTDTKVVDPSAHANMPSAPSITGDSVYEATLSGDGNVIAYTLLNENLADSGNPNAYIHLFNRSGGTTTTVNLTAGHSVAGSSLVLSSDGGKLAYSTQDASGYYHGYLFSGGTSTEVATALDGTVANLSDKPWIAVSPDGGTALYLAAGGKAILYDLTSSSRAVLAKNTTGGSAWVSSTGGVTNDGWGAYVTSDSNIVAGDTNSRYDVFIQQGNSAPVFTSAEVAAGYTDTAAYDSSFSDATGTLTATDADGQTVTYGIDTGTVTGGVATLAGTYGTLTVNTASGAYTYTPNVSAINAVPGGQTPTDSFQVTASDGIAVTKQAFTITITGAADTPTAASDTATAVEAGGTLDGTAGTDPSGNVLTNDTAVDIGDTKTVSVLAGGTVGVAKAGSYGTLTLNANGSYTYVVDNASSTVQALRTAGQTLTDSFSYTMRNSAGLTASSTLTVTIQGADDAPVAVADTASATEAGGTANSTAGTDPSGNVLTNDTDVDSGDTKTVSAITGGTVGAAKAGSYGTLTLNANGSYGYAVDNSNTAVQALRTTAQTLTDTFTYTVQDTAGLTASTTLTVTIHGADDAPVAVADTAIAVEAGGVVNGTAGTNPTGNVLTNDTDVDSVANGETKVVSAIAGGTVGTGRVGNYGTLTLNADGSYAYGVDNDNAAVQALRIPTQTLTDTFTYTVRDTAGLTASVTLVVTIRGTNDAPVVSIPLADTNQTQIVGWSWGYRIPDGSFTDVDSVPNGETATYTAALADGSPLPGWMKFDAVTRTFSATPAIGTYNANVRVTVTDTAGASVYDDFRVALDIRPPPVALPAPPAPPPPAAAPEPKPLPPPAPDVIIPDRGKGDGGKGDGGTGAGTGSGSGFGEAGGGLAGRANDGGIRALTGLVPLAPTLTAASIGAFRVAVVADTARTTGADAIVIAKPIGEVVQVGLVSFIVPVDAFAHTKADAVVTLHATQADGSPLPSWLQFDAATGRFGGMPPAGQDRALQIKVMARDTTGHEAAQIFKMDVRGNRQAGEIIKPGVRYAFAGRPGLGAQILAVRAGADRIAGLVRMARAS